MKFPKRISKLALVFVGTWLASSVAFSNGSAAPELPLLEDAKTAAEMPLLRRLQELTLELQMVELTIKNKRNEEIESKISAALKSIEQDGLTLSDTFKAIRADQLRGVAELFELARGYGAELGVSKIQWEELKAALSDGAIKAGTVTVLRKSGPLNVLEISPLAIGHQMVWNISLPLPDQHNFWSQARKANRENDKRLRPIRERALTARIDLINDAYKAAEVLAKQYFTTGYARLYSAFEDQRYAILQRITLARKALMELGNTHTAMGTPEEYSVMYNTVLENLFSYGVDLSLSGVQRDFAVKGFLFATSPEEAQTLLKKLKYAPQMASYNSPSS